jgi:hypothetical protein
VPSPVVDPELALRLLVEDAIAQSTDDFRAVTTRLNDVMTWGRAFRAVGALDPADVAALVAEAELALLIRGAAWLESVLSDLPSITAVQDAAARARAGALVSVATTGDTMIEVWEGALSVRNVGSDAWGMAGAVPEGHDRLEVRTSTGVVTFDLAGGAPRRDVDDHVVQRPLGIVDLMMIWAAVASPAALAHAALSAWRPVPPPDFEPVAVRAGDVTVIAIERGDVLHAHYPTPPAVSWIVSEDGVHLVSDGIVIDPAVPPPPSPLTLVLVDGGTATEIPLRP